MAKRLADCMQRWQNFFADARWAFGGKEPLSYDGLRVAHAGVLDNIDDDHRMTPQP